MIEPKWLMVMAVLAVAAALVIYGRVVRGPNFLKEAGIWKGIAAFLLVLLTPIILFGCSGGQWMNETEIFMGVDYARKTSPVCEGGQGDRVGSHGGVSQNMYTQGPYKWNIAYLHESCAVDDDDKTKDAILMDFRYQIVDDLMPWI